MRIFITGANGFIGGAVASVLIAQGHTVRGLIRNEATADAVRRHGIEPVIGSLDDAVLLEAERLGWAPKHRSITEWVSNELVR